MAAARAWEDFREHVRNMRSGRLKQALEKTAMLVGAEETGDDEGKPTGAGAASDMPENSFPTMADELIRRAPAMCLDLGGAPVGLTGAQRLAEALGMRGSALHLRYLDVSSSGLTNNGGRPEGLRELVYALRGHSGLQYLNLSRNQMGKRGVGAVANVLGDGKSLRNLRFLNLGRNNLRSAGVALVARALDVRRSPGMALLSLDLSENNAGDDGAATDAEGVTEVCAMLLEHPTLTSVDLSRNGLGGDRVSEKVAEVLEGNSVLQDLRLDGNKFGPEDASLFASALSHNNTLTRLGLRDNRLYTDGATALAACLPPPHLPPLQPDDLLSTPTTLGRPGSALAVLDLRDNTISRHGRALVAEAVIPLAPGVAEAAALAKSDATEAERQLREGQMRLARGLGSHGRKPVLNRRSKYARDDDLEDDIEPELPSPVGQNRDEDRAASPSPSWAFPTETAEGATEQKEPEEEGTPTPTPTPTPTSTEAPPSPAVAGSAINAARAAREKRIADQKIEAVRTEEDRKTMYETLRQQAQEQERNIHVDLDAEPLVLRSPATGVLVLLS